MLINNRIIEIKFFPIPSNTTINLKAETDSTLCLRFKPSPLSPSKSIKTRQLHNRNQALSRLFKHNH